jgi:hypothetical protein
MMTENPHPGHTFDDGAPVLSDLDASAGFEEVEDDPTEDAPQAATAVLDADAFYQVFRGMVALPNVLIGLQGEPPLQALQVDEANPSARAASDALYETIQDVPALHWLLAPESVWLKRALTIGAFVVPTAMAARAEYGERQAARRADRQGSEEPAQGFPSDNPPPAPGNVVVAVPQDGDE